MKINNFKEKRISGYIPKSMIVLIGKKNNHHESMENVTGYLDERYKGELDFVVVENKSFDIRFLHGLHVNLMQVGETNDDLIDWVMDEMDKFKIPIFSITVKNDEKTYYPHIVIKSELENKLEIVKQLKDNLSAQWRAYQ